MKLDKHGFEVTEDGKSNPVAFLSQFATGDGPKKRWEAVLEYLPGRKQTLFLYGACPTITTAARTPGPRRAPDTLPSDVARNKRGRHSFYDAELNAHCIYVAYDSSNDPKSTTMLAYRYKNAKK